MAITTLESHHRHNSVVIPEPVSCNLPHLPPPPYSQNPPLPGDGTDNLKVSRTMSRCPQTTKRLRLNAVDSERAFLNIRHAIFTPPLFSRNSRFPSRSLPPPGLRGCNLDAVDTKVFKVGDRVRVRRLNIGEEQSSWSEWQRGEVVSYIPMRVYLGNFGHAYCVRVQYVQFLGEICPDDDLDHEEDFLTAEECRKRRQKANYIYTRIPSDKSISGLPDKNVWTPAEILSWVKPGHIFVRSLAGPTAGEKLVVKEAIPYTLEAAVACRKHGEFVIGPTGQLFLTDIAIKPLQKAQLDPSAVALPSLSALTPPFQQ
ncbi:hypothetical protein B0H14DRAFT_2727920 [Mycena olivaceomarginata]|nr:hypothetical protein B0H14DRAFT_2727920 [Mycena olivaceomarginata]